MLKFSGFSCLTSCLLKAQYVCLQKGTDATYARGSEAARERLASACERCSASNYIRREHAIHAVDEQSKPGAPGARKTRGRGDGHQRRRAVRGIPKAQYAFKFLLVHGILQVTMFITLRCALHRRSNRDIRR